MDRIEMILFDIDGVITDGRRYVDGKGIELKSLSFKDLDAFKLLKGAGYKIGCITGEDNTFSRQFFQMPIMDYVKIGCKQKLDALKEAEEKHNIASNQICYIGDGKYDIPVLEKVGLSMCPNDAIEEVKRVADIILSAKGGEGCIAEVYSLLFKADRKPCANCVVSNEAMSILRRHLTEHREIINEITEDDIYARQIVTAIGMIEKGYQKGGCLFLCGNGESAVDAQRLAEEMVVRFYLERKVLNVEVLTVNALILTSLLSDYDFNMIFARQIEVKAKEEDILIGITANGVSENMVQAFRKAKQKHMQTILMSGLISEYASILRYTDCLLAVPSQNVSHVQEMHILLGHVICKIIEQRLVERFEN